MRSLPFAIKAYVPCDVKGEWARVAHAIDGGVVLRIGFGSTTRLNPLDPGPKPTSVDAGEWQRAVTTRRRQLLNAVAETALGRALHPVEHTALDIALDHAAASTDRVCIPAVVDALREPSADLALRERSTVAELVAAGSDVHHGLRRLVRGDLAGLFDKPSTAQFDPSSPMVVLDLSSLAFAGMSTDLVGLVMTCASAWLEAAIADPDRRETVGHLRRSVAAAARAPAGPADAGPMETVTRLRDREPHGHPPALRPRRRRRRCIRSPRNRRRSPRGLLHPHRLPARNRSARSRRRQARTHPPERELLPHLDRGSGLWKIGQASHVIHHQLHRCVTHANPEHERINQPCAPRICERAVYSTDDAMTGNRG